MEIGGYEIVRELGRGGQAVVYLARDSRLGRSVALQVLTGLGGVEDAALARFRREAEVTSRLDHPGICAVYEAGVHEGTPFIAMRHVEGLPLARLIAERGPESSSSDSMHFEFTETGGGEDEPRDEEPAVTATSSLDRDETRSMAALIEKAARALHVAHEAGIVHRDIKPGNIMRAEDGRPVILDFGLAAVEEDVDGPGLTRTGDLMGTPAYMSPEQIRADHGRIDRRTDVYALGVTLYECVTGARPFAAPTRERLYQAILGDAPPDPRGMNRTVSRDLAVIIATAMEKQADRRYQSALDLAEELERFLRGEPILAKPPGYLVRTVRWVQRNRAQSVAMVTAFLLVAAVTHTIAAVGRERNAEEKASLAEDKADLAEKLRSAIEADRNRVDRERRELAQRDSDAAFSKRAEELATEYGFMNLGVRGRMNYFPLLEKYFRAFRDFDLALDDEASIAAAVPRIHGIFERDPTLGRTVMRALYALLDLYDTAELSRAAEVDDPGPPEWARDEDIERWEDLADEHEDHVARYRPMVALSREAEVEDDFRKLRATTLAWNRDREEERVKELLREIDLEAASLEFLVDLSDLFYVIPSLRGKADEIIDDAVRQHPDSFSLRIVRGGMALQGGRDGDEADLNRAAIDLEVAVALNPGSGIAYTMLGAALVMDQKTGPGLEIIERATEVEPENPGVWFMAANMWAFGEETRDRARQACRRALELDPSLDAARALLEKLGG